MAIVYGTLVVYEPHPTNKDSARERAWFSLFKNVRNAKRLIHSKRWQYWINDLGIPKPRIFEFRYDTEDSTANALAITSEVQ